MCYALCQEWAALTFQTKFVCRAEQLVAIVVPQITAMDKRCKLVDEQLHRSLFNQLVRQQHSLARTLNCGKPLRALSTKLCMKVQSGHVNSVGYGNNDKDWAIRIQAPKSTLIGYGEGSTTIMGSA